jgi:hypothetical protein
MTAHLVRLDRADASCGPQHGRPDGDEHRMDPQQLRAELEGKGLTVLGVGQHRSSPEILIVYLHGNDGQWVDGRARRVVSSVPGVLTVSDSVQSPTILLVRTGRAEAGGSSGP